jgi:hypothetical protein
MLAHRQLRLLARSSLPSCKTKFLFHAKQIAFERECHSNGSVVRTRVPFERGSDSNALLVCQVFHIACDFADNVIYLR